MEEIQEVLRIVEEELGGEEVSKEELKLILTEILGDEPSEEELEEIFERVNKKIKITGENFTVNGMITYLQKDYPLLTKEEEKALLEEFFLLRESAKEMLTENPYPIVSFLKKADEKEIKASFIDKELTLKNIKEKKESWIHMLENHQWPQELEIRTVYLIQFLKEIGEDAVSKRLKEIRDKMILSNIRLVASIAGKYSLYANYEDLFQEGIFGLEKALDKFNPNEKTKFATYATWWIRQAVSRGANSLNGTVRTPPNKESNLKFLSIDCPLNDDGFTLEKVMHSTVDVEEEVMERMIRERVRKSLSVLNKYEQKVIQMKYYRGMKPSEIAEALGTKSSYITQLEREALKKLRYILMDYKEN